MQLSCKLNNTGMAHLYVITGQTATGKTQYALDLATQINGELINADSRQIYQKLNIITGKDLPTKAKFIQFTQKSAFTIGYYQHGPARIWLYDMVDPTIYFSSFDFQECVKLVIEDIINRNKVPILVGGTYLYLKHVLYDVLTEHIPPDQELRDGLVTQTIPQLQTLLSSLHPQLYQTLNHSDQFNPQRLIRKIEIANYLVQHQRNYEDFLQPSSSYAYSAKLAQLLKVPLSQLTVEFKGFQLDKLTLAKSIHDRIEERLKKGALEEVKNLLKQGYSLSDPGLQTIGYQELGQYVSGEISYQEALQQWITKEIQYAKRQLTFMKKDKNIVF